LNLLPSSSSSSSSSFFIFWEFPNGRVLLIFLHNDKVWSNFSLDAFFIILFLWFCKTDICPS
jgi:hypothetical protein